MKKNTYLKHCLNFATLVSFLFLSSGCSECYTSSLQLAAKYERCQDLGVSFSEKIRPNGAMVHTYVCSTSDGDMFADFIVTNSGKLCRTFEHDY